MNLGSTLLGGIMENIPPFILAPPVQSAYRPHSPSAKPSLASQRDHSACNVLPTALVVRKKREDNLEATLEIPPPCHSCEIVHEPRESIAQQSSISRRMFKAVRTGISRASASDKTSTASTVSTAELVSDFDVNARPPLQITHEAEYSAIVSALHTHQAHRQLGVPYISLEAISDTAEIGINQQRDVWIAIRATMLCHSFEVDEHGYAQRISAPAKGVTKLTSLRMALVTAPRSRILQTLGHKSAKTLKLGEHCELFILLRVPKYKPPVSDTDVDLVAAIADLESTLGTLEEDVLSVDVRCRHALLDATNLTSARQTIRMLRTNAELG